MYLVTAEEIQKMDGETIDSFGIPGRTLMESAGRGAYTMLVQTFPDIFSKNVGVIAGRGNNGGDAFVVARYLMEKNIRTNIFILCSKNKITGDAKANLDLVEKLIEEKLITNNNNSSITEITDLDTFKQNRSKLLHHDIFVDGILGTGLNSDVRGFFKNVIEALNQSKSPIFSIDIPSGLNADTGKPWGISINATATATFAHPKIGHLLHPGDKHTGELEVVDIGIPKFITEKFNPKLNLLEEKDIKLLFQPRHSESHKGNFGHLLILAGSPGKTGAAALATNAAMRCGTGLVTLGIPQSLNATVEPQVTEAMTCPLPDEGQGILIESAFKTIIETAKDKNAIAIGPGIGTDKSTKKLIEKLIKTLDIPIIMDADCLNLIAENPQILKKAKSDITLTPHPGEMARLASTTTEEIQSNRLESARNFADEFSITIVLKGANTIISLSDKKAFLCPVGNPGMASGGMGDVLTGMIAGFKAQGFSSEHASITGAYIHGLCGDMLAESMGTFGFLASDMIKTIPETIAQMIHKDFT
ncbi:MAG: NAD(P)H-hydrate dehydratase [Desulfobacteraceae bacterium]|nr:NAD(P)H-hydrate dehydratase [Desulfobacteraceae bacterium]